MTHYETLDIPRTATADEVKQAFRRNASAEHPDKGGNAEAMAAINRAYETLGDPERRARYDETGNDQAPKPLEEEARNMLRQLLNAAIENSDGNWLAEASEMLGKHAIGLLDVQLKASAKLDRMVKRTGKVRVKAGENLVQQVLDQQIGQLNQQIAAVRRAMLVNKTAAAMLTAYEQNEEASPFAQQEAAGQLLGSMSQQARGGWR